MWTFTIIALSTILVAFNADYLYSETSPKLNAFFISTARNFWGVLIAWFVFALHFGSCKWLGDFMSHRFWMPLGKLSFSIYLTHPVLQYVLITSNKQPIDFGTLQLVKI